ncbi:MAG: hypothetical protein L3K26_19170, partial [Candidatus Hydrogenedentes bacterium]|nr:hypothetical protein [Candidatus Hydrogenedentota bacterium]
MNNDKNSPEDEAKEPDAQEESTGNAALGKRLATGVLQGDSGTEAAQVWISAFLIAALGFVVYLYAFSIPLHGDDLALLGGDAPIGRIVTSLDALPDMPTAPLTVLGLSLNVLLG